MKKKKKHLIRCIVALLLSPLVLVVTAAVLLYVPFIQRWAVRQAVTYVNENTERYIMENVITEEHHILEWDLIKVYLWMTCKEYGLVNQIIQVINLLMKS